MVYLPDSGRNPEGHNDYLLEPEPDDGLGEVLWFAFGGLVVDGLPVCDGWLPWLVLD